MYGLYHQIDFLLDSASLSVDICAIEIWYSLDVVDAWRTAEYDFAQCAQNLLVIALKP